MKHSKKIGRTGKYPKHQVRATSDPQETREFYRKTDDQAPLSGSQLAAGLIQHPGTGLQQLWLSTNGLDVTSLAAFRDQARANLALEDLKAFLRTPGVYDGDACAACFARLRADGDAEPEPLPDDQVREIGRGILRRVVDGPR